MRIIGRIIAILAVITGTAAAAPLLSDAQTRTALAAMARASEDGLDPGAYGISAPLDPAARDATISAVFLTYMRDVHSGRPELRTLDPDVVLPASDFDAAAALNEAVSNGKLDALLASLAPPAPDYASLKAALARYRRIAAAGGWPFVLPGAESEVLRARLAFEDNITGLSDAEALKHFQARHGLTQDGTLGLATLSALNIPASARADTIAANMERWRWLPRQLEADRIVINVADARLDLFLGGNQVLTSRVIVGKPATRTPILRADGAGVTVNPPWTVPASIAAREILPKLKRNPAYLVSQDMVLLDGPAGDPQGLHINWRAIPAGHFPYKLRQHPGARIRWAASRLSCPISSTSICMTRPEKRRSMPPTVTSVMAVCGLSRYCRWRLMLWPQISAPCRKSATRLTQGAPLICRLPGNCRFIFCTGRPSRTKPVRWSFALTFMAGTNACSTPAIPYAWPPIP